MNVQWRRISFLAIRISAKWTKETEKEREKERMKKRQQESSNSVALFDMEMMKRNMRHII